MMIWSKLKRMIFRNKVLVENYLFVSVLNAFTLILPLITYPYLIGKLGDYLYGHIIFAFTITTYVVVIAAYGYDISAVKDVAQFQDHKKRLNEIVTTVLFTKLFLCLGCLVLLIAGLFVFEVGEKALYILFSGYCLGEILFPGWFFQGIQRLKYLTYFNVIYKSVFTILVFTVIRSAEDYIYYPILYSVGTLGGTVYGLVVMFHVYHVRLTRISWRMIHYRFKRSTAIFYSRIADILIEKTNTILLGKFAGMEEVAYYDLANKLVRLGFYPIMILNQVIYPKIAAERNFLLMKKVIKYSLLVAIGLCGVFICLVPFAVEVLGKGQMQPAVWMAYILSPTIIFNSVIYLQGSPTLVAAGFFREFNRSMWISFFVYFVLLGSIFLFRQQSSVYMIIVVQVVTNLSLMLARWYYIRKCKIFRS